MPFFSAVRAYRTLLFFDIDRLRRFFLWDRSILGNALQRKGGLPLTTVNIDTVFVLNGILDYLLLLSTARLAAAPFQRLRLALGALLGAGYAVLVFLPGCGIFARPVFRLVAMLLMTLTAYGARRGSLRLTVLFLALSCVLAGILMMVSLFWQVSLSYPQGIPSSGMDWKALLLAGAVCYWLSSTVLKRLVPHHGRELLPVKLRWADRQVGLTALTDSGNLLTDPAGSGPVLVAEWQKVAPLLPLEPRITKDDVADPIRGLARLSDGWGEGRLHLLPYHGIGVSHGLLLAVRVDSAVLDKQVIHRQLVALSPEHLSDGSYQGVIGIAHSGTGGTV